MIAAGASMLPVDTFKYALGTKIMTARGHVTVCNCIETNRTTKLLKHRFDRNGELDIGVIIRIRQHSSLYFFATTCTVKAAQ